VSNEDNKIKKERVLERGRMVEGLLKHAGWNYLLEKLSLVKGSYDLSGAVSWDDYKFRLGVLKGISLIEEISKATIGSYNKIRLERQKTS
jgi:hypothetical protein